MVRLGTTKPFRREQGRGLTADWGRAGQNSSEEFRAPESGSAGVVRAGGYNTVSPTRFCFIERPVRLLDDPLPIAIGLGIDGVGCHSATDRHAHLLRPFPAPKLLLLDAPPHPLRGSHGAMKILITQEKQNFFSTVTEGRVVGPQAFTNRAGDIS